MPRKFGCGTSGHCDTAYVNPARGTAPGQADAMLPTVCREVGFEDLVCLGTFKNNRHVFDWQGHTVEVCPPPPPTPAGAWSTCLMRQLRRERQFLPDSWQSTER